MIKSCFDFMTASTLAFVRMGVDYTYTVFSIEIRLIYCPVKHPHGLRKATIATASEIKTLYPVSDLLLLK